MNTLYILCGLPYSGKTTLRKQIIQKLDYSYISIDEYMDQHDMWREGHPVQEDWNTAYTESYKKLEEFLKAGKTVIFDTGNLKLEERMKAEKIAENNGVPYKLIYVNTSLEEIKRRRVENEQTKQRGHLDDEMMQTALNMFEEPTADENPVFYNSSFNLDVWIKDNLL